jgi:hypothetical protein
MAGVQEVSMIATFDVRIECPWCGQGVDLPDATTSVRIRCDDCAITVDLADPAPVAQGAGLPAVAA